VVWLVGEASLGLGGAREGDGACCAGGRVGNLPFGAYDTLLCCGRSSVMLDPELSLAVVDIINYEYYH